MEKNENERMKKFIEKGWNFRNFQNFEIRAKDDKDKSEDEEMVIEGVACVFDTETTLFEWEGIEYKEKVDKNAFKEADMSDVIFNYNHGGRVYARTRNDSLHLEIKEDGMHVTVKLNPEDEGHKELYRDIKNGLIDKMSYAYTVSEESYDVDTHVRTVLKIKKLYDVSAVDIPAYDSTSISARSVLDLEKSEMEKLENEILKKKQEQRKRIALAIEIERKVK
ncbi:MAG: HK97 family phage prohead protease [Mycoplasmoidaceae bacterium]|nr:HK97 family phage prohead protease [Mycoplasmoidaceae bacterium]